MQCPGNSNEDCGGPGALTLYHNPTNAVKAPELPSGWKAAGCVQDGVNGAGRTLSGYSYVSDDMTLAKCVNTCNDRKFAYAGVEYGSECWCGNEPAVSLTGLEI
jgi:hypothetical protein